MTRALRTLDRLDARAPQGPVLPRSWSPVTGPGAVRSRTRQRQLAGLGVLAACLAAPYLLPHVLPARAVSSATGPLPPRGVGASPYRLVPAVVGPPGSGGFRFERAHARATTIYDTALAVFRAAASDGVPPAVAADRLAERRMAEVGRLRTFRVPG